MKLKDLLNQQLFCWFEMIDKKFIYTRNDEILEIQDDEKTHRVDLDFVVKNVDKEVKVVKTVMQVYEEIGY